MQIIRAGHEHSRPQHDQLVTVKCCGRLEDGTEIDRHDELKLVLGDADFIDGEGLSVFEILSYTLHTFTSVLLLQNQHLHCCTNAKYS